MAWLIHRWLLLVWISLSLFKDSKSLFMRHAMNGKCVVGKLSRDATWGTVHYADLDDRCLDDGAQFYYTDTKLLRNREQKGTFLTRDDTAYGRRFIFYYGKTAGPIRYYYNNTVYSLEQTIHGSLFLDQKVYCATTVSDKYLERTTSCADSPDQKFTFGSVTQFNSKMKDVHCSPVQRMAIKKADYGNFENGVKLNDNAQIDTTCSSLANCEVKTRCGGNRSCELAFDSNLLPSQYCPDTSKQIYTEYTCVDPSNVATSIMSAPKTRLSDSGSEGFIEIKDGSTWRKVDEIKWDKDAQKMLCQHLGFNKTDKNDKVSKEVASAQEIASGHLVYNNTQPSGPPSCVYLEPSTTSSKVNLPYVTCKICDKPLLQNVSIFPNRVFSGMGGTNGYEEARFSNNGWCAAGSGVNLLINLQKEYHITRIVTLGDKNQEKWSQSYSLKFNRTESSVDQSRKFEITGNKNGYQASATIVNIYNVRYLKIQSENTDDFCLRIEICGEVQTPAPVTSLVTQPSNFSVHLSWTFPTAKNSSYITRFIIKLNGMKERDVSRDASKITLDGLQPYTAYTVTIVSQDAYSQTSREKSKKFNTSQAVPNGPPLNVAFTSRCKNSLNVSWNAPEERLRRGVITGYQVCHSTGDTAPVCQTSTTLSFNISKLQPSTKYFVTVAAGTKAGYGNKSSKISKITNGEPVNPVPESYSSLSLSITKPAHYIKEVMVVVQVAKSNPRTTEDIATNELKPHGERMDGKDPYIAAYFEADKLPSTFVIGDGKEYYSAKQNYSNPPLQQNSSYIVFLRFFESQDIYFSTDWSGSVKTMVMPLVPDRPPLNVAFISRSKNSLEVSWKAPDQKYWRRVITGYQVCHSTSGTTPVCQESTTLSFTIQNLQPSTKYFVTVAAGTKVGYGNKSLEISKFTNGERANPVASSYHSLGLFIEKPTKYVKDVMVIVQKATSISTQSEDIKTSELKPYQTNTRDPYITAYSKPDALPLSFVIGDGKIYDFAEKKYINQPLEQNSSYIVFLRFLESQDMYYSTEWSRSVKTMINHLLFSGPPLDVVLKPRGKNSLEVSWKAPVERSQDAVVTGYQVCISTSAVVSSKCFNTQKLSLTIENLQPATKYFVTVSAETSVGFGEKSLEQSTITNEEPVDPVPMSYYTLALDIQKPSRQHVKEIMVIVSPVTKDPTPSEDIETNQLKPYQRNTQDPYVTAYLKTDLLPLTFVIGDGKEYNSDEEKCFNQPLEQNTGYVVFLRFLESKESYSTEWSNSVVTMSKPQEFVDNQESKSLSNDETRMDLIIPLVVVSLCFLLLLGLFAYLQVKQRRELQELRKQHRHKCDKTKIPEYATGRNEKFDPIQGHESTYESIEGANAALGNSYVNEERVYETTEDILAPDNTTKSRPDQESSTYTSLTNKQEPLNFYQPLQPPSRGTTTDKRKGGNQCDKNKAERTMEYENPAFNAKYSDE